MRNIAIIVILLSILASCMTQQNTCKKRTLKINKKTGLHSSK